MHVIEKVKNLWATSQRVIYETRKWIRILYIWILDVTFNKGGIFYTFVFLNSSLYDVLRWN